MYFSTGSIATTPLGEPVPCIEQLTPTEMVEMINLRLKNTFKVS